VALLKNEWVFPEKMPSRALSHKHSGAIKTNLASGIFLEKI